MLVSGQVKCHWTWAFSLVFDIQWIHCQYLLQTELYLDHQYSESVSNKNLALYRRQNSCPGTTLIFLAFSYWAIRRVFTCSPSTLRQFSSILRNMSFPYSQKRYQTPAHNVASAHSFLLHISSLSKSSKLLILQFLVKWCKLHSVFKILLRS